ANVASEPLDIEAGQVAKRDIEAPFRIVNRYRTDILRSTEADRAVKEAVDNEANYVVNQAAALLAHERIDDAFRLVVEATAVGAGASSAAGTSTDAGSPPAVDAAAVRDEVEARVGVG